MVLFKAVVHEALENIGLHQNRQSVLGFEPVGIVGESGKCFHVSVQLIIEAALEATALTGKLGLVDGEVLVASGRCTHRAIAGEPSGTTKLPTAGADTAHPGGFLPGTDLPHLDFYLEILRKLTDELPKVHPAIGGVVERGFFAIALELHVAHFHIEFEGMGDGSGSNHRFLFHLANLIEFFEVTLIGLADYFWEKAVRRYPFFAHLKAHQLAGERNAAYVAASLGIYDHHIASGGSGIGLVEIKSFASTIFKTHFHDLKRVHIFDFHRGEPVEGVEAVAAPGGATAFALAPGGCAGFFRTY